MKDYTIVNDKVCKIVEGVQKILIPRDLRWRVTKTFYDNSGHSHRERTFESVKATYWLTDIKKFIKKFTTNCIAYITRKRPTGKRRLGCR